MANFNNSINNNSQNLVVNRYKLQRLLGKGSMGQVYSAIDNNFKDVHVAIKFLSQSLVDEKIRLRFETEAKISALLGEQSDYIVKVKDYGLNNQKTPFYVMELLEGKSLDKIIKQHTLSLGRFLSLTKQICLALKCAHNGIVVNGQLSSIIHKDIKPSNIFMVKDVDGQELIKILDFGIAQVISDDNKSNTEIFMGTLKYCSPEQMDKKELDHRSDIYSLGVTMYEMLTKDLPIKSENNNFQSWYLAHHNQSPNPLPSYLNLPADLADIIIKCLEKSPENRPKNVTEILKVINLVERTSNSSNNFVDEKITSLRTLTSKKLLPIQEKYLQRGWPANKPQNKIVFPMLTESQEGKFVSLWTMLENQDLIQFNSHSTFCYGHFLYQNSPHPMLLWLNLLYNRNYDPKWLIVYLDLKTKSGHQMVANLIRNQSYHILLFELYKPQQYQEILSAKISAEKRNKLEFDLYKSQSWQGEKQPEASKQILREKIDQVKFAIVQSITKATSF